MTTVHVTCDVRIVDPPAFPVDKFHERGEALMDRLMDLEDLNPDVTDMTLSGDAGRAEWSIAMLVVSDDDFGALTTALAIIRTALHDLGGATPEWPTADDIRLAIQTERVLEPV